MPAQPESPKASECEQQSIKESILKDLSRLAIALLFFWFYNVYLLEKSDIVERFKEKNENYPLSYYLSFFTYFHLDFCIYL